MSSSEITHVEEGSRIGGFLRKPVFWVWTREVYVEVVDNVVSYFTAVDESRLGCFRLSATTEVNVVGKKLILRDFGGRCVSFLAKFPPDLKVWVRVLTSCVACLSGPVPRDDDKKYDLEGFFGGEIDPRTGCPRWVPRVYAVSRVIGFGAYGLVAEAVEVLANNKRCAIKKVENAFADLTDARRLLREIQLLSQLDHPNIVPIFDCFARPNFDHVFLVMGLMESDLHHVIYSRNAKLTVPHVKLLGYQLFLALRHCHASNVLHRDVKPGNILVNENCELKLCDFGLARTADSPMVPPVTPSDGGGGGNDDLTGYVVTRWYRAPELLLSCGPYSTPIDVWSGGCIVAEMTLRKALFAGSDVASQVDLIVGKLRAVEPDQFCALDSFVSSPRERAYIDRVRPAKAFDDWAQLFPTLDADGIEAMAGLLQFNPATRLTAAQATNHPFFSDARDYSEDHFKRLHAPAATPDAIDLAPIEAAKTKEDLLAVLHHLQRAWASDADDLPQDPFEETGRHVETQPTSVSAKRTISSSKRASRLAAAIFGRNCRRSAGHTHDQKLPPSKSDPVRNAFASPKASKFTDPPVLVEPRESSSSSSRAADGEDHREAAAQAAAMMGVHAESPPPNACAGVLGATFEGLVEALIRPSRAEYEFSDLGPLEGSVLDAGKRVRRDDWTLTNGRGLKLHGSWWRIWALGSPEPPAPECVIVFLHANSSSRVEALRAGALRAALTCGCDLVAFDFAGSGWSEGQYVSLGYFERYDVVDVVAFISGSSRARCPGRTEPKFVLWGRSMGATTALLYAALPGAHHPAGLVLDSAFCSVRTIVEDLVSRGKFKLPRIAARAILAALRKTTTDRTGGARVVDVDVFRPLPKTLDAREWLALGAVRRSSSTIPDDDAATIMRAAAWRAAPAGGGASSSSSSSNNNNNNSAACAAVRCPALSLGGRFDDFIPPSVHMDPICDRYAGTVVSLRFDGAHNSLRPLWVRDAIATFIRGVFNNKLDLAVRTIALLSAATDRSTQPFDSEAHLTDLRADLATDRLLNTLVDELMVFALSFHICGRDASIPAVTQVACDLSLSYFNLPHCHASSLLDTGWGPLLDVNTSVP
ncbi:hypothetical protein CTAYLR_008722 [Chrysophaeum taylorii]|uniref:Mitogen-activated protein kinase n=1 Tax=Chrysophaeum taylorii TaxID=2483200 RepID=A0AAD7XS26_9STRA|nr:hypothetical protein CTAYLR_008722 [Chrysophaeum taylorii]